MDDATQYRLALRATALAYVGAGWPVIPLAQVTYDGDGKKTIKPLIRWQREPASIVTTAEQVERWFGLTGKAEGLAIATGALLAIDLDEYKAAYGGVELPAGGWQEQHAGRGGGHVYLANPGGQRNTAGGLAPGVDTRGDGGLSVAAPTRCVHADGRVTQWQTVRPVSELPRVDQLPPAPEPAVRRAARERSAPGTATEVAPEAAAFSVARARDEWLSSVHGGRHETLIRYLAVLVRYRLAQGVELSALIGELQDAADEHPDAQAGEQFETVDAAISWAIDAARATPWVLKKPEGLEARFTPPDPARPAERPGALPTLSGEFWAARPVLAHLRDAAWSRRLAPDAVFHAVLARLAAGRRAVIGIDSGIEDSSLNYFAAIIGASGAGKSRAWRLAGRLLALDPDHCLTRPLGSGEGVSEAFMGVVQSIDPESMKTIKLRTQVRRNVLFELDEGQALTAMLQRSGATIGPALRSAWSGAVLGQQNADAERNRRVTDYATGLVAGFQPDAMQALIDDTHTGMPQRFAFVAATDPALPRERPDYPGALPANLSGVLEGMSANPFGSRDVEFGAMVTVPPQVTDELDAALLAVGTGAVTPAELDSQRIAMMLRFAGLLALLEGRFAVDDEDWQLAGQLWAVSAGVRDALVARAAETAERARDAADERYAARQVRTAAEVANAPAAVERIAIRLARHVHAEGALTRGPARRMLASRDRGLFDAAVELAEARGWVTTSDSKLTPGTSRPVDKS